MTNQTVIRLTAQQRGTCHQNAIASDSRAHRALVLLHADRGDGRSYKDNETIAEVAGVDPRTVARVRAAFAEHGFDAALHGRARAATWSPDIVPVRPVALHPVALDGMDKGDGGAEMRSRLRHTERHGEAAPIRLPGPGKAGPGWPSSLPRSATAQVARGNEALVRQVVDEIWNAGDLELADECFAPDYMNHGGLIPDLVRGPEVIKISVVLYRLAFPAFRISVTDLLARGQTVALRWAALPTSLDSLPGGAAIDGSNAWTGMTFARVVADKIAESWTCWERRSG